MRRGASSREKSGKGEMGPLATGLGRQPGADPGRARGSPGLGKEGGHLNRVGGQAEVGGQETSLPVEPSGIIRLLWERGGGATPPSGLLLALLCGLQNF